MSRSFPKSFLWGAASSSHQIEENKNNDWTEWEEQNHQRLAENSLKKYSRLKYIDQILHAAQTPSNYISEHGTFGIKNFDVDLDLMDSLGLNTYRFSIEWSRIEPEKGEYNYEAIAIYENMLDKLNARGIKPMLTLWHFTLPKWVAKNGGWVNPDTVDHFVNFSKLIINKFKGKVDLWITLNEPNVYSNQVYLIGAWLSEETSLKNLYSCMDNFVSAHEKVSNIIQKVDPGSPYSVAFNVTDVDVALNFPFKNSLRRFGRKLFNYYFLERFLENSNFIGLNHYHKSTLTLKGFKLNHDAEEESDLGWGLYPESLGLILHDLKKYDLPIYITENGLADAADNRRENFIKVSLKEVQNALNDNVDVKGYYYFSLTDNFEWADGFFPKFGLAEIAQDYSRKLRSSAFKFKEIIKANGSNL